MDAPGRGRLPRTLAVLVTAAFTCAACGAAVVPTPAQQPVQQTASRRPAPTAARNRRAAAAEARRLLTVVHLPAAATPTSPPPAGSALAAPAMGRPAVQSSIDLTRYWRIPAPMGTVWSYLQAHPPTGLRRLGTSIGPGDPLGQIATAGIAWWEPDRPYATGLELQVGLVPSRGGTLVRVDGMAIWRDPVPLPAAHGGRRLRVQVASGCPRSDRRAIGVSNPAGQGDLHAAMLPKADPSAALVCRYTGLNGRHPLMLASHRRLPATAARRLARAVRAIPLAHSVGGVSSCPAGTGQVTAMAFAYLGRPDVDVWYEPSGCATISNGFIMAEARLDRFHPSAAPLFEPMPRASGSTPFRQPIPHADRACAPPSPAAVHARTRARPAW